MNPCYSLLLLLYFLILFLNNKTLFVPLKVPDDSTLKYISYNPLSDIPTIAVSAIKGLTKVASSKNRVVLKNIFTSIKKKQKNLGASQFPKWDFQSINAMKNHNHLPFIFCGNYKKTPSNTYSICQQSIQP